MLETLFQSLRAGALEMPNRIVMAPLTRCFADAHLVPQPISAPYYAKRAGAGLIVSEATIIRPDGQGYPTTPGIYTSAQVAGWNPIVEAVHRAGGRFFCQLWHVGRVSHRYYLGKEPIAPSAVPLSGKINRMNALEYGTPRALELGEIAPIVRDYAHAAACAMDAGFDGVEIHGANTYLIEQFLRANTNRRSDANGGSIEHRLRFAIEVVDAILARVPADRVGIRLSPAAYSSIPAEPEDAETYARLLAALAERGLCYVHGAVSDDLKEWPDIGARPSAFLKKHFGGVVIACGGHTPESAAATIGEGTADLVAFGKPFIANPDLVERVRRGAPLASYDPATLSQLV